MTAFSVNAILPTTAAPALLNTAAAAQVSPPRFGKIQSSSSSSSAFNNALTGTAVAPVAIADMAGPNNVNVIAKALLALSNLFFPSSAIPVFQQSVVKTAAGDVAVYTPVQGFQAHQLDIKA